MLTYHDDQKVCVLLPSSVQTLNTIGTNDNQDIFNFFRPLKIKLNRTTNTSTHATEVKPLISA